MSYVIVQDCPVPAKLAPFLRVVLAESGARLQSCYRGADATALLHQCGKSSQAELYKGYADHRPGFNPANPPGRSTHELRSDGAAYPNVPVGGALQWWQCGIDIDDAHVVAFIAACAKHGWVAWRPYSAGSEYHHVNFRKPPVLQRAKATVLHALGGGGRAPHAA